MASNMMPELNELVLRQDLLFSRHYEVCIHLLKGILSVNQHAKRSTRLIIKINGGFSSSSYEPPCIQTHKTAIMPVEIYII